MLLVQGTADQHLFSLVGLMDFSFNIVKLCIWLLGVCLTKILTFRHVDPFCDRVLARIAITVLSDRLHNGFVSHFFKLFCSTSLGLNNSFLDHLVLCLHAFVEIFIIILLSCQNLGHSFLLFFSQELSVGIGLFLFFGLFFIILLLFR